MRRLLTNFRKELRNGDSKSRLGGAARYFLLAERRAQRTLSLALETFRRKFKIRIFEIFDFRFGILSRF